MEAVKNTLKINVIAAVDSEWGISKKGHIPWIIKEDTNYFQDVTKCVRDSAPNKKNAVIIGKNTWLSLPKVNNEFVGLKDRINIVVSNTIFSQLPHTSIFDGNDNVLFHSDGVYIVKSLQEAIELCNKLPVNDIFICGGSMLYAEALKTLTINKFYLTIIDHNYKCDNFFPVRDFTKDIVCDYSKSFTVTDVANNITPGITFFRYDLSGGESYGCINDVLLINREESKYLKLLNTIINFGSREQTRNGYTYSLFGKHLSFDLSRGFPLLTTKKVFFKGIVEELLFFLRGDTNTNHLVEKGVNIWRDNTSRQFLDSVGLQHYEEGDQGPMYGFQLLHNGAEYKGMREDYAGKGFDQLSYCINLLKTNPFSRRIMMTTYDPSVAKEGCLYPCHGISIIFNVHTGLHSVGDAVENTYVLSCMMTQRSADMFLGIPFNIASYALLVHVICESINNDESYKGNRYVPGVLTMSLGDVHIYESHYTQCIRQILREPFPFPMLKINKKLKSITDFTFEDVELVEYKHHPIITAKMVA